jgi:hypothetical protein
VATPGRAEGGRKRRSKPSLDTTGYCKDAPILRLFLGQDNGSGFGNKKDDPAIKATMKDQMESYKAKAQQKRRR